MRIGTSSMSKEIDNICINKLNIPSIVLMENAALKVVKNIKLDEYESFVIVCGRGNNGGDGFAVARHLHVLGKNVKIYLIGEEQGLRGDCKINYDILIKMGIKINKINNIDDLTEFRECLINSKSLVIDAIFGTGLSRNVEGIYSEVISIINENSFYTLSIDVPSGFNSDNGEIMGISIQANKTISFQLYKKGFLKYGSDKIIGEVIVENIGVPLNVVKDVCDKDFLLDKNKIKNIIKVREKHSHKGDFGRSLIIAGSNGFSGAAYISAEAAVRSGTGLVTLAVPKEIQDVLSIKLTEAMTVSLEEKDKLKDLIKQSNSMAMGPGMGNNEKTLKTLEFIIKEGNCPIIIDADGLNVLCKRKDILENCKNHLILTPHPGEMSRLTGLSIEDINKDRVDIAKEFAKKYNITLVLKGYNTIITDGERLFVNSTGTSTMASGGMGDCLTGIIASFIAQGYSTIEAACISVYLHGYCGDKLSKEMFNVNVSDILKQIPYCIKEIKS